MSSFVDSDLPGIADVRAAAVRLAGRIVTTPLVESPLLNARLGLRLLVKAESLQRTGSFKFRGAMNAVLQLDPRRHRGGVVAFSSGNHAQGVAAAAQLLGIPAAIVMPADAPAIKVGNTRGYGTEVVFYDRWRDNREAIGARIAAERGAMLVPPFDDPRVIAGQGTVGLEVMAQTKALGASLDALVVPASGGGFLTGCALAVAAESPTTKVYSAEPDVADDWRRSLAAGKRVANDPTARSICDALLVPSPGEITFALGQKLVAGGLTASDAEVLRAVAIAFAELKLVLEPSGAVALAAVLAGKLAASEKTIAVVASGGNVDRDVFLKALAGD